MKYSELNLNEALQKGLDETGYVECTPVQEKVLSVSLDGSDLYVQSQTGTGKTAAFLVTIMQQLLLSAGKKKSLVMVPTRELAVQVEEEASRLAKYTSLKTASFYGGVGYEEQIKTLEDGVDIIIGTPGRILDLNGSKKMDLSEVCFLAIDEADRMFDMGFYPDLRKIVALLPPAESRQTMLFSATLNSYVKNLAWEYTKDAKEITIEAENITVDEIDQELFHVSSEDKIRLLTGILAKENPESLIIFCNTKKMCEILSKRLEINGIANKYIIGDLPQSKRLKIMNSFKSGKIKCLIATDVAARGIDVNDLQMVVNFDLPNEAENYVHRIGRTARAGKSGKAYTFCSEQDVYSLMPIERYIEKQIPSRVASEEDFGEDKSKNVYIKLENHRDSDDFDSKNRRNSKSRRNGKNTSGRQRSSMEKRGGKNSTNSKNFNSQNFKRTPDKNRNKLSSEELETLSRLSTDERMKYYMEKYGGAGKANANDVKAQKQQKKRQNTKKSASSQGRNSGRAQKSASAENMQKKSPQKKSLFARIKSIFGSKGNK